MKTMKKTRQKGRKKNKGEPKNENNRSKSQEREIHILPATRIKDLITGLT